MFTRMPAECIMSIHLGECACVRVCVLQVKGTSITRSLLKIPGLRSHHRPAKAQGGPNLCIRNPPVPA